MDETCARDSWGEGGDLVTLRVRVENHMNCDLMKSAQPSPHLVQAEVVRLTLSGQWLPPVEETLPWGDVVRSAAMSRYGRLNHGQTTPGLSGKEPDGRPLRGHRHISYLPTDEDGDGRLDHITLFTPVGLNPKELAAVASIDALSPIGTSPAVYVSITSIGTVSEFRDILPMFGLSSRWRSLTPYVLSRHVKFRGTPDSKGFRRMVDGPEDQVAREVRARWAVGPDLIRVQRRDPREPILPMNPGKVPGQPPLEFYRRRHSGGAGGGAFNFLLEWAGPIPGPLALGFGCHYGLGLFVPA